MYSVEFVDDLPAGRDWAIAFDDGRTVLFVRSGRATPDVLEQAWRGFVAMQYDAGVPEQRRSPEEHSPTLVYF